MPLTNAERQKRYRQRLIGLARSASAPTAPVPIEASRDPNSGSLLQAKVARLEEEVARLTAATLQPPVDNEDAAFIALLKSSYAAGAMRLLSHNGSFDREPEGMIDVACHLAADELTENPCTALDLVSAADDAGERWALKRMEAVIRRLQDEQAAERAATKLGIISLALHRPEVVQEPPVAAKKRERRLQASTR